MVAGAAAAVEAGGTTVTLLRFAGLVTICTLRGVLLTSTRMACCPVPGCPVPGCPAPGCPGIGRPRSWLSSARIWLGDNVPAGPPAC